MEKSRGKHESMHPQATANILMVQRKDSVINCARKPNYFFLNLKLDHLTYCAKNQLKMDQIP